jgi:hypothetical protein
MVAINPVLNRIDTKTLTVGDPVKATAPASLVLKASLTARTATTNQIGFVLLEAAELATADSVLTDLGVLRSRSQTLFTSREAQNVKARGDILPVSTEFSRELTLVNNQSVRFFQVTDASLDELTSAADSRLQFFTIDELSSNAQSASLRSSEGVGFKLELQAGDLGLNAMIGQEQGIAPVLDLSAFNTGQTLKGTLVQGREADLDSITGFYYVLDTLGTVKAEDGTLVRPGEVSHERYREVALQSQNRIDVLSGLTMADNQTASKEVEVRASGYLAPFMEVQGNTFFAFEQANIDQYSHFKMLAGNLFGGEDILGGGDRDHDDHVFGIIFNQVVNTVA